MLVHSYTASEQQNTSKPGGREQKGSDPKETSKALLRLSRALEEHLSQAVDDRKESII